MFKYTMYWLDLYIYVQIYNVLVRLISMFKYTMYWLDLYICSSIQYTG